MEDIKIIDLYWQRSQEAITQTDIKYGKLCHKISYDILSSHEDSEECVSDTYMTVWNSLPPQRPSYFQAFVAAIARNLSLKRLRDRYAKKRGGGEAALVLEELSDCFTSERSIEQEYEQRKLTEAIDEFLYSLSADSRCIFLCRYWLFLPVMEIARRLKCSKSKVTTSLFRTRQRLQQYLTKEGLI